jgi:hypothetical protein
VVSPVSRMVPMIMRAYNSPRVKEEADKAFSSYKRYPGYSSSGEAVYIGVRRPSIDREA